MPVTVHPATTQLSSVDVGYYTRASEAKGLLNSACKPVSKKCGEIFQSSFASGSSNASSGVSKSAERFAAIDLSKSVVCPDNNGFVTTAVQAYSHHHHLVIRPDDVWIAILTQFNLYVNANAETLRSVFVEHEGKKELNVSSVGSRYSVDFGAMAEQMGHLIQQNVKDPELREWIIPSFSTTTDNDVIVSSVVMMATLKAYFSYKFSLLCGLPAVTLLGEKADWEKLVLRAEKLPSYGEQATQWHSLLRPVLAAFVRSFEDPHSQQTKDFWQKIAHHSGGGSGPTFLSGWITAFCFFDSKGKPLYSDLSVWKQTDLDKRRKMKLNVDAYNKRARKRVDTASIPLANAEDELGNLTLEAFHRVDPVRTPQVDDQQTNWNEFGFLTLDEVAFHHVDIDSIPVAYGEVDVKLDDNGTEIDTVMVAGLVGMEISSSGVQAGDHKGEDDTVQPVPGWWLCEKVVTPPTRGRLVDV